MRRAVQGVPAVPLGKKTAAQACPSGGSRRVQVALKERGIDKLLDEAREDNKENDARLTAPKSERQPTPFPPPPPPATGRLRLLTAGLDRVTWRGLGPWLPRGGSRRLALALSMCSRYAVCP